MNRASRARTTLIAGSVLIAGVVFSGAASAAETYVVERNVRVPPGEGRNVTVYCDRGDRALSGGYRAGHDTVPGHFGPNERRNADGWRFVFANPRSSRITVAYQVLCLRR